MVIAIKVNATYPLFLSHVFQCEVDEEVEYEFPVYNQQEMIEGLWEPDDVKFAKYGGLRLYTAPGLYHLFTSLFPYMQVLTKKTYHSLHSQT